MSAFDYKIGAPKRRTSIFEDSSNSTSRSNHLHRTKNTSSPVTTFYAATGIYSRKISKKYPTDVGNLSIKVFDDE